MTRSNKAKHISEIGIKLPKKPSEKKVVTKVVKKKSKEVSTLILKNGETPKLVIEGFPLHKELSDFQETFEKENTDPKTPPKEKKKEGRPSSITERALAKLQEAFAMDCTVKEACLYACISQDAYFRYIRENPDFRHRIELLRNFPVLVARTSAIRGLREDPDRAMRYLAVKKKDEFSTRIENINTNLNTDTHMVDDRVANTVKKSLGAFGKKLAELSIKNQAKADKKR